MKYCHICGFPAPNDAKYCEKCGKSLVGKSDMPNQPFTIPSIGGGNKRNQQSSYNQENGASLPSFLTGKNNRPSNGDEDFGFDFDTPQGQEYQTIRKDKPKKEKNKLLRYIIGFIFILISILAFVFIREGIAASKITYENAEKILYATVNDIEYCENLLGKPETITNESDIFTYTWNSWLKDDEIIITFRKSELDDVYFVKNIYFNGNEVLFNTATSKTN